MRFALLRCVPDRSATARRRRIGRRAASVGLCALVAGSALWGGPAAATGDTAHDTVQWVPPVAVPLELMRRVDLPSDLEARPWQSAHRGADLGVAVGDPVFAAGSGVVVFAGGLAGRGVVSIDHLDTARDGHGALRTTYEPVDPLVTTGDSVGRGEAIGTVQAGGTHCSTTCLHWGLRQGQTYRDPLALLSTRRVRLLPHLDDARPAGAGSTEVHTPTAAADVAPMTSSNAGDRVGSAPTIGRVGTNSPAPLVATATTTSVAAAAALTAWLRRRPRT